MHTELFIYSHFCFADFLTMVIIFWFHFSAPSPSASVYGITFMAREMYLFSIIGFFTIQAQILPESPMRDRYSSYSYSDRGSTKIIYFLKNLLKLVFWHTSLGYKGLSIDPFKRIENLLINYNFPKDIFCTHQNTVFIYRYSAVASWSDLNNRPKKNYRWAEVHEQIEKWTVFLTDGFGR